MKRNVSVVCVCSAPNCCDTEQRSASQPGSVASGTHCIYSPYLKMLEIFSFRSQAPFSSIKYVCRCMAKLSDLIGSDWHLSDKILSSCFIEMVTYLKCFSVGGIFLKLTMRNAKLVLVLTEESSYTA